MSAPATARDDEGAGAGVKEASAGGNYTCAAAALEIVKLGVPVFPVASKKPLTPHGFKDASTDPNAVTKWWERWPEANIGMPTGEPSGVFVLDVDGDAGRDTLAALEREHGRLPETLTVATGGGGEHYYFHHVPGLGGTAGRLGTGIDTRGEGGYVIVPPSVHESGNAYRVTREVPLDALAEVPGWIVAAARKERRHEGDIAPQGTMWSLNVPVGQRNVTLTRRAGFLVARGVRGDALYAVIHGMNAAFAEPLPEREVSSILTSASRWSNGDDWPEPMGDAAFHGLVGEIMRKIEPHTEADIHAILVQFLVFVGNAVGRAPHVMVERDRHGANLFFVVVGASAMARKGTAKGQAMAPVAAADPHWTRDRQASGISSGEGLIYAVRDRVLRERDGRMVEVDPGVSDKRLNVTEPEFGGLLRRAGREGNTASSELRQGWDGHRLQVMTRNSPLKATDPHISIVGHITTDELRKELRSVEQANGFANRFGFILARRSKDLPFGGDIDSEDFTAEVEAIRKALMFGRFGRFSHRIEPAAREVWAAMYADLMTDRPGHVGHLLARGSAHVLRLALVFALLDRSRVIGVPHLEAAREVWRYAEDSTAIIFGRATGDALADDLLTHLRGAGAAGLTRTDIRDKLGRHARRDAVDTALRTLASRELATKATEATKGRSIERWKIANAEASATKATLRPKVPNT